MRQRWLFLLLLCQPNEGVPDGNGCLALGVGWGFLNSRLPWVCPFTYWCRCQLSMQPLLVGMLDAVECCREPVKMVEVSLEEEVNSPANVTTGCGTRRGTGCGRTGAGGGGILRGGGRYSGAGGDARMVV
jgi:hypothetical protein